MAPTERSSKRQKLSPTEEQPPPPTPAAATTSKPAESAESAAPATPLPPSQKSPTSPTSANTRSSWYNRTWPRKAAPITQVARESISSASNAAKETASVVKDKVTASPSRKSSLALTLGKTTSNKALPVGAMTTKDHATPQGKTPSQRESESRVTSPDLRSDDAKTAAGPPVPENSLDATKTVTESREEPAKQQAATSENMAPRSWIGWLARGDGLQTKTEPTTDAPKPQDESQRPTQQPVLKEPTIPPKEPEELKTASTSDSQPDKQASTAAQRKSWLPIWNNVTASQSAPLITSPTDAPKDQAVLLQEPAEARSIQPEQDLGKTDEPVNRTAEMKPDPQTTQKSSAWIFWSREKPTETSSLRDQPREGEIAVANTDSESRPRRASLDINNTTNRDSLVSDGSKDTTSAKSTKQAKYKTKGSKDLKQPSLKPVDETTKAESKSASATAFAPTENIPPRPDSPVPPKKTYEHLLLPRFYDTLKLPETPSLLQQLSRLFYSTKEPDMKHLSLVKDPPRIKTALAIGVHGYFPAPLIRSVLGQPTGTSIKFADMAAKSIRRYTKSHGYECQVRTAALEGEGRIAERLDLLWKLLLNWIEEVRKADFILVACHSQGVPVAIMLVAKLIHFGCINSARVGICAMAGVNMGPFPEYKSRWISGSAGELFEFSDAASKVSTDYFAALDDVLRFGVRLTYVGSIDDQLVSLESSIFAPISHPHIYRAVSIDSKLNGGDFVSHLVAFALKLRNLGVQDHGLIRELSAPLAGSLYGGDGHSRLYEDDAIYDLAVLFTLETSSMHGVPVIKRDVAASGQNPYILPFAMRGILEEDFVKSDLQQEASLLLQQFDEWKPTTKALKDVKFRLEGIRSKL